VGRAETSSQHLEHMQVVNSQSSLVKFATTLQHSKANTPIVVNSVPLEDTSSIQDQDTAMQSNQVPSSIAMQVKLKRARRAGLMNNRTGETVFQKKKTLVVREMG